MVPAPLIPASDKVLKKERDRGTVCFRLLVDVVISISMKPHCVPGNVVRFHLRIVVFGKRQTCVCLREAEV